MTLFKSAGFLMGILGCSLAPAQQKTQFLRLQCVKVADGKSAEFEAVLPENRKLAKVRVDSGRTAYSIVSRAVYPAGRSAACDYHFVEAYDGFPPEAASPEQAQADFKKSGITMSQEEYRAKLLGSSYLVSQELWRLRGGYGDVSKGSYVRINYNKVKPGMGTEYLKWENTGWKQLAEAAAKEIPGTSWSLYTLTMPGGSDQPYNAMTVDGFPSWEAMGKGLPVQELWKKVHPDVDYVQHMGKMNTVLDRPRVEVFRVLDKIAK
ncbi:MAG TPA: hypothetical protein VMS37_29945 [Verrucomicrobiae bacterium]|nr:hypothetical protein [Verrucomicrobiae bacterium]